MQPFGLYYLGNDRVLDWLVASLESVRQHGYQGPITLIPYNDKITRLTKLAAQYNFSIWQSDSFLELDRLGLTLDPALPSQVHTFRKLAAFWGEYEYFLFSDADVIALTNYQEVLDAFRQSQFDFMYFSAPVAHVYQPPFLDEMIRDYNAPRFNAGFLAGRHGVFTLEEIAGYVERARLVRKHFAPDTNDQPFVNYCTDIKQLPRGHLADVLPEFSRVHAAKRPLKMQANIARMDEPANPSYGKRLAFIHWSGFSLNPWMPKRDIFLQYRLAPMSPAARWWRRLVWQVIFGPAPWLRQIANRLPGLRQSLGYLYRKSSRTRKLRNMTVRLDEPGE
jgi:hypothetical protein